MRRLEPLPADMSENHGDTTIMTATDSPVGQEHQVDAEFERPLVSYRPVEEADMDITPMIDVTFLLLIFFLVASRIDQNTSVELPPARHGTAVSAKNSVVLTVAASPDGEALVYKADGRDEAQRITAVDPADQEDQIASYIEAGLTGPDAKPYVLVKAERRVKHADVVRVARAVRKAGGDALYVAVLEEE